MIKFLQLIIFLYFISANGAFAQKRELKIPILKNEKWWGGRVNQGDIMPYREGYKTSLLEQNDFNQSQPLLISSKGRYVWCNQPFAFEITSDSLKIFNAYDKIIVDSSSDKSLRSAYLTASSKFFPFTGAAPDIALFNAPQFNTWIDLTYNQNQTGILEYANAVVKQGFPPGVLMIDESWSKAFGIWEFDCARFTNPKKMVDSLHQMGFKVMVWVCPFISMDIPDFRILRDQKALIRAGKHGASYKFNGDVLPITWWDGMSAALDFTNPLAVKWFNDKLEYLHKNYGIDGFKFDYGDPMFYPLGFESFVPSLPNDHGELYAQFGLKYPLNEYRGTWKMGGQPLAQRLRDKNHKWDDLQKLIPHMLTEGILGYPYSCPDMIGGGDYAVFLNLENFDKNLVVRSAQIHALMPMMQFSLAPWKVLDEEHLNAIKKSVQTRIKYTPEILRLVDEAKKTGEPIVRYMEYNYPNAGFAEIKDQFFLGERILVAPVVQQNMFQRQVVLPKGKWKDDRGKLFKGPATIMIDVPLDRIPIFELQ